MFPAETLKKNTKTSSGSGSGKQRGASEITGKEFEYR